MSIEKKIKINQVVICKVLTDSIEKKGKCDIIKMSKKGGINAFFKIKRESKKD
ncbi:MAG: hypothetical protein RSB67_01755 [Clostridia bacterium]